MTIQFPNSPTQGESFVATNGVSYTYDNGGWIANSQLGLDDRFVNADGDTMTGDLTVPSLNGGQLAGFRNQIINGDFGVWQRGINFSLPLSSGQTNVYTADRFRSATDTTATVGRSTNTPAGFAFAITLSAGSNGLYQGIELRSDSSGNVQAGVFSVGSVWTYSIWSDVDLTSKRVLVRWADTAALSNPSTIETSTNFVAVAGSTNNGYTKYTSTVTINSSPANPQKCLVVYFGSVGVAAKYTGVQFEPGPVSTPFEHRPVGTELALCQRYYEKTQVPAGQYINFVSTGGANGFVCFCQYATKRTTPTYIVSSVGVRNQGGSTDVKTLAMSGIVSKSSKSVSIKLEKAGLAGPVIVLSGGNVTVDAEL